MLNSSNAIELLQGESRGVSFLIVTSVASCGVLVEEPVDLTGSTAYFSVRLKKDSPDLLLSKTSASLTEIEILSPATNGSLVVYFSSGDTISMAPRQYVFDMWIKSATGAPRPVIRSGEFIVDYAITRSF